MCAARICRTKASARFFDAASELDVPLFLHPVDPPGRDRTGDYELTVVAGYLFDSTINVFRMICSNFLDRYGDLKLVLCTYRRVQPDAAQPHAARGRHQRDAVAYAAAQGRRLSARTSISTPCASSRTTCAMAAGHRSGGASPARAAMRRSRSASPIPVNFVRRALPAEQAELALSKNYSRLIGR